MNKKLLILIATLVVVLPIVAGCTLRVPGDERSAPEVPHAVNDVRFNNCLVCHASAMWGTEGKIWDHVEEGFTNQDCLDCH